MLQRLPTTLAQVKEGNSSENLVNKICRILSTRKQIAKKVHTTKSIKLHYRMNTIFMNSNILLLNL